MGLQAIWIIESNTIAQRDIKSKELIRNSKNKYKEANGMVGSF